MGMIMMENTYLHSKNGDPHTSEAFQELSRAVFYRELSTCVPNLENSYLFKQ